ncbi:MAG: HAD family phosphatase [Firmicutes bacterium]|nr:HAD family phosphatase [Bacillota bacterium]
MYKLIALDIDGTLINKQLQLTQATRRAVKAARSQGVQVTLATGRSFHSALPYAEDLGIELPLICANGAVVRKPDGTVLHESAFAPELAAEAVAAMLAANTLVHVFHNDGISCAGPGFSFWRWLNMIVEHKTPANLLYGFQEFRRNRLCRESGLEEKLRQDAINTHKIFAAGSEAQLSGLHAEFGKLGISLEFYPGYNGHMYLELMPAGASKGAAVAWLAKELAIPMEQVIAVGDNLNDLTMVKAAGLGVAMGNAHQELKDLADHITLCNEEDGVAAVIRDFILATDKFSEATRGA